MVKVIPNKQIAESWVNIKAGKNWSNSTKQDNANFTNSITFRGLKTDGGVLWWCLMKTIQLLTTTVLLLGATITSSSACGLPPNYIENDNVKKIIAEHQDKAEKGDLESLKAMVDLYTTRCGMMITFERAEYWLKKIDNKTNSAEHQFTLGSIHYDGHFIYDKLSTDFRDTRKALIWLRKAADQGHEDAQVLIEKIRESQKETKAGAWSAMDSHSARAIER